MIRLDIENRTRLLPRQSTFAGSAWTAFVVGVPVEIDGYSVTGVEVRVVKGSDVYVKSSVVGGVQHYVRQSMVYDEEMAAWGAEWVGDYVLEGGEFREVAHA